jgi:hypothetical protein
MSRARMVQLLTLFLLVVSSKDALSDDCYSLPSGVDLVLASATHAARANGEVRCLAVNGEENYEASFIGNISIHQVNPATSFASPFRDRANGSATLARQPNSAPRPATRHSFPPPAATRATPTSRANSVRRIPLPHLTRQPIPILGREVASLVVVATVRWIPPERVAIPSSSACMVTTGFRDWPSRWHSTSTRLVIGS